MNQELVIQKAVGFYPQMGKKFPNPFREDNSPRCYFAWDRPRNYIRLYDWGNSTFHRMNCFDLIFYSKYGRKIASDTDLKDATKMIREIEDGPIVLNKSYDSKFNFTLNVKIAPLNQPTLDYYAQFGITRYQLMEDMVSGVKTYTYNTERNPRLFYEYTPQEVSAALWRGSRKKVYQPLTQDKTFKWKTDCISEDIYWWNKAPSEFALVLASHKDGRVAANWGYPTIAFQSESSIPNNIDEIFAKHNKLLYIGDNDKAGLDHGRALLQKLEGKPIFHTPMPSHLLNYGIKDLAKFKKMGGSKMQFNEFLFPKS